MDARDFNEADDRAVELHAGGACTHPSGQASSARLCAAWKLDPLHTDSKMAVGNRTKIITEPVE